MQHKCMNHGYLKRKLTHAEQNQRLILVLLPTLVKHLTQNNQPSHLPAMFNFFK
jgi:hypothetical protein